MRRRFLLVTFRWLANDGAGNDDRRRRGNVRITRVTINNIVVRRQRDRAACATRCAANRAQRTIQSQVV